MMKKCFLVLTMAAFLFSLQTEAQTKKLELVWSDEFDYNGLPDSTKWNYDVGGHGWGNDELQFYTHKRLENARVENGKLVIEAIKEDYKGSGYTSTRLVTKGKGDWLYGRVEVRAKLPKGRGTWPAIWMLPTHWTYGAWPESGEIDIMEHVGYDPDMVHFSVHCLDYFFKIGTQKSSQRKMFRTDSIFYTYATEWYPDRIEGYIDDSLYFTFRNEHAGWTKWPFDKPFHLILNIAVGGGWGAVMGIDETIWPQKMEVDYVRVYKYISDTDTIVPTAPQSLSAVCAGNRISLAWQPAYDNYGVKKYEVFCNDKPVGKSKQHSFDVKGLKPSTAYYFKVEAIDWEGNRSPALEDKFSTLHEAAHPVPGKIEAESYIAEEGAVIEPVSDTLGGYNLGWVEPGDWMEYEIEVRKAGRYSIAYRAATERKDAVIQLLDDKGSLLCLTPVGNTKGWQKWESFTSPTVNLKTGRQIIKLHIVGDRINLNWFEIKQAQ
ncbi:MAG: family 16 glycosylhydrolase [Bacteroidales bacterium]|nr:family 16 glycosylhydrolase [Bacteroidales bacterium]